jgi:hypothetical protein
LRSNLRCFGRLKCAFFNWKLTLRPGCSWRAFPPLCDLRALLYGFSSFFAADSETLRNIPVSLALSASGPNSTTLFPRVPTPRMRGKSLVIDVVRDPWNFGTEISRTSTSTTAQLRHLGLIEIGEHLPWGIKRRARWKNQSQR